MRKTAIPLLMLCLLVSTWAAEVLKTAPLLALRTARKGYENIIWMDQRVKIGGESVNGYIQGIGGSDDALMAFSFENEWDMLVATIGYKDTTPEGKECEFMVEAGDQVLFTSGVMESKGGSQEVRVPIRGHRNILLRITSDRYNGTAGAAWGQPTVLSGLTPEQMQNDWNLSVNNRKTSLPNNSAPAEVLLPFDVPPSDVEAEYRVKIRRDNEARTVIVEYEREDS